MSRAFFRELANDAAARYKVAGHFAYRFALGKLTWDPALAHIVTHGLIPRGSRVLDLGCGPGLLAALIEAARGRGNSWPALPPDSVSYHGIDRHPRDIECANRALAGCAQFLCADIRSAPFEAADVVVLLDVLHYFDRDCQEDVLLRARAALRGGGVLLLRVADESPTLRYRYTIAMDRIGTTLRGHRIDRLHCRPLKAWVRMLEALDFDVTATAMRSGPPFANVLLVARYDRHPKNETRPTIGLHDDELPRPGVGADARCPS